MISRPVEEDIDRIINDGKISWNLLSGSRILIAGATGLIGSFLYSTLIAANNKMKLNIRIICLGRNKEKLSRLDGADVFCADLKYSDCCNGLPDKVDYIFHCAAVTKSAEMVSDPVGTILTSIYGTDNLLKYAVECDCKGFVYLSSMEAYGKTDLPEVNEKNLGYIDLTNIRSCYPESKRMCENLCISYMKQYGVPVKIARLAQTFGAGTPKDDTRVFAQFARSAIDGTDIILHSDGSSRGNYIYLSEAVSGLLYIILNGSDGEIYNVSNPDSSCTIREMAEIVTRDICHNSIKAVIDAGNDEIKRQYATKTEHRLNSDKLQLLGWNPIVGLKEMYERLIKDWKEKI